MLHSTVTKGTRVVRRFDGKAGIVVSGGTLDNGQGWVAVEMDNGTWSGTLDAWDYADTTTTTAPTCGITECATHATTTDAFGNLVPPVPCPDCNAPLIVSTDATILECRCGWSAWTRNTDLVIATTTTNIAALTEAQARSTDPEARGPLTA